MIFFQIHLYLIHIRHIKLCFSYDIKFFIFYHCNYTGCNNKVPIRTCASVAP